MKPIKKFSSNCSRNYMFSKPSLFLFQDLILIEIKCFSRRIKMLLWSIFWFYLKIFKYSFLRVGFNLSHTFIIKFFLLHFSFSISLTHKLAHTFKHKHTHTHTHTSTFERIYWMVFVECNLLSTSWVTGWLGWIVSSVL